MAAKNEKSGDDVLDRIRNFPVGATPEDQMRELMAGGADNLPHSEDDIILAKQSAMDAVDYLYDVMEKEGPFDGVIGYSEGATIAATLLLHEQRRFEVYGIEPMLKCALFFAGWPPLTPEFDQLVLADQSDLTITIPTCHISQSTVLIYNEYC